MKKLFLIASLMGGGANAFAAPAVGYSCVGKNKADKQSIVFSVLFSNWSQGPGYANQTITITSKGGVEINVPVVLQMSGATDKNKCKKNDMGEIYMKSAISMTPTATNDPSADYKIQFKLDCGADQTYDVSSYCVFQL